MTPCFSGLEVRDHLTGLGRVGLGSRLGASGRHRARARIILK